MGFVHALAKAHQKTGFAGGRVSKQGGRDIKQAFNDHADHEFLSTLDTVHWTTTYGLAKLKGKGRDELSAIMTLPGEDFSPAANLEVGLWIRGRITLASNSQDKLYSGFYGDYGAPHEGDAESVKHRDKSSGRNKRPSMSKGFQKYDKLKRGNKYMEKMAKGHPYVLDRTTWKPEGVNEALVDNWSPVGIVVRLPDVQKSILFAKDLKSVEDIEALTAGSVKQILLLSMNLGTPVYGTNRQKLWSPENA